MKIGYDVSVLEGGRFTGVEKYALYLFRFLWEQAKNDEHLLFCRTQSKSLGQLPNHVRVVIVPDSRFWRAGPLTRAIRRELVDVFVSPVPALPRSSGIPMIALVHECPWRHPTCEPINWRHRIALWLAGVKAKVLLTNSEMTREDIRADLGRFAPPVELVPPSFDPGVVAGELVPSRAQMLASLGLADRPYCLFVSTIRPKKNVGLLAEAFAHPSMADIDLICAGKVADPSIVDRVRSLGADNVHFLGYTENEVVAALYKNAEAFLYVSLNEGFGLPILEAFANGCPVIASHGGSIPEVAGDGAYYLDALSPLAIRKAVEEVRSDDALRIRLAEGGAERLEVYSWAKSATTLLTLLQRIAK